jgi:phosphatidylglycerophosphate synthase
MALEEGRVVNSSKEIHRQAKPKTIFPLIRHLSYPVTFLLLRTKLTANQVTVISIPFGLAAVMSLLPGTYEFNILAGLLLLLSYLLDHCDGEVARARQTSSPIGHNLDTFADWVVNSLVFAAMGHGIHAGTQQVIWIWLGWAAAAGSTINYMIALYANRQKQAENRERHVPEPESEVGNHERPRLIKMFSIALREFARADFCFILLAVVLLDGLNYLLPLAAIGAQVYWILYFAVRGEDHRV